MESCLDSVGGRDSKGLYKKALAGELKDVAGVDLKLAPPARPDLVIRNEDSREELLRHAPALAARLVGAK